MLSLTVNPEAYAKLTEALTWRWVRHEYALRNPRYGGKLSPVWRGRPVWRLTKWKVGAVNAMFAMASLPKPFSEPHA